MDFNKIKEVISNHIDEGILVVNDRYKILSINNKGRELLGIENDEIIGKDLTSVFSVEIENSHIAKVIKSGKPLINYYNKYMSLSVKKNEVLISTYPIFKNSKIVGAIEIYREMHQYNKLESGFHTLKTSCSKNNIKSNRDKAFDNGTIYTCKDIIGDSKEIIDLKRKIMRIADIESPVLVYGETGTGKELLVQALHNSSEYRKKRPFVAQNCAALPDTLLESVLFGTTIGSYTDAKNRPGLFELANNGTLFLDEINSMDIKLQGKLLRVLQDGIIRRIGDEKTKKVNTRVVVSTNEEPSKLVEEGRLRKDLYYRLNVVYLEIPPLRKRQSDIIVLTNYFINHYNKVLNKNVQKISTKLMDVFNNFSWPGNIRELKYTIENIMNLIDKDEESIGISNISDSIINRIFENTNNNDDRIDDIIFTKSLKENIKEYEVMLIKNALKKTNGNCSKAAKILQTPKQTLYSKIKKYNIIWKITYEE